MHRTKCMIVEDNPADMELLVHYVNKEQTLQLTHTFLNGLEAMPLIKQIRPPLLLMDIDMPVLNGISLFKNLGYSPLCIFVTAHSEYALDSYEAQAFDFILKPVTDRRFEETIRRLNEYLLLRQRADLYDTAFERESITIKEGTINHRVPLSDILYIEALKDYSKVVTLKKKYITLSKLKHFIDKLPPENFLRIHRSYAIAKNKIITYDRDEVTIDKVKLPIGKTYRQEARMALDN